MTLLHISELADAYLKNPIRKGFWNVDNYQSMYQSDIGRGSF